MKNRNRVFGTAIALSSLSLLFSCTKSKDSNTDQLASLGKASITGVVIAKTVDTVGAITTQAAPGGVVINAWIDTKDYVLGASSGNYARRYFSTTTNDAGFFSLDVDVSMYKPATLHIEPAQFEKNVLKKYTSGPNAGDIYYERKVFNSSTVYNRTVNHNDKLIIDIPYN